MGVSGLTQYLIGQAAFKSVALENVKSSVLTAPALTLIVDGLSLAHFLRRQCKKYPCLFYLEVFRHECYAFLDWLKEYNVRVAHVVFDGAFDNSKLETRLSRRSARSKTLDYTRQMLLKPGPLDSAPKQSTLLELNALNDVTSMTPYREVLVACLQERNINVVVSNSEADSVVASLCRDTADSVVLADDSDFFIFGVPLVLTSSLNYVSPSQKPALSTGTTSSSEIETTIAREDILRCRLFSPESVLTCLQIPSSSLLYLSILAGNDYSGNLPILFARGAGFAGKCSNSSQRIGSVLNWLRKSDNISAGLDRLFRKQKVMGEYTTAYNSTLAQLSSSRSKSPFTGPLENVPSCQYIWELHQCGKLPTFVLGVATSHRYWTPLVLSSQEFHDALLPIRSSFYRGLFRSVPQPAVTSSSHKKRPPHQDSKPPTSQLIYPSEVTVSEIDDVLDSSYQVLLGDSEPAFPLQLDPLKFTACSLEDFFLHFGLNSSRIPAFLDISSTFGSDMTLLLFAVMALQAQGVEIRDALFLALVKHLLVLKSPNWYSVVSNLPLTLPSLEVMELSSAVVVMVGWVKTINELCGNPLKSAPSAPIYFDGLVFAFMVEGNPSVVELCVEGGVESMIDFWRS